MARQHRPRTVATAVQVAVEVDMEVFPLHIQRAVLETHQALVLLKETMEELASKMDRAITLVAAEVERITGRLREILSRDLKRRGLLEETLVVWCTEFGRMPTFQKGASGRDHNPEGFTMWLAGGGVKPGFRWGTTDDYGFFAQENKVHIHDLHATLLHLLGLDHLRLTYRYAGRDFRLTDVHGNVLHDIFA